MTACHVPIDFHYSTWNFWPLHISSPKPKGTPQLHFAVVSHIKINLTLIVPLIVLRMLFSQCRNTQELRMLTVPTSKERPRDFLAEKLNFPTSTIQYHLINHMQPIQLLKYHQSVLLVLVVLLPAFSSAGCSLVSYLSDRCFRSLSLTLHQLDASVSLLMICGADWRLLALILKMPPMCQQQPVIEWLQQHGSS